jgi:putative transposase
MNILPLKTRQYPGLLQNIYPTLSITYLVLDGHFGNNNALQMVRQCGLHLISKLRCDAALHFAYQCSYAGKGPRKKYGDKINYDQLPDKYLVETSVDRQIEKPMRRAASWT